MEKKKFKGRCFMDSMKKRKTRGQNNLYHEKWIHGNVMQKLQNLVNVESWAFPGEKMSQ